MDKHDEYYLKLKRGLIVRKLLGLFEKQAADQKHRMIFQAGSNEVGGLREFQTFIIGEREEFGKKKKSLETGSQLNVESRTEEISGDGEFSERDVGTVRKVTNQKQKMILLKGE